MENQEKSLRTATEPSKETIYIDTDITEQILLRLPVRSLQRFQLVCKDWRNMIQEPRFKKAHLELNNKTNEPLQLLVLKHVVGHQVVREEMMVLDEDLQPHKIWMPHDSSSLWHFRGSCNGLLCTELKGEITVFNPITHEVVSLPKPTNITGYELAKLEMMHTEFVFHLATGEYKVLLFYWNNSMDSCIVSMYVLGANSPWRQVSEICEFPCNVGVNVDDTLYWPSLRILPLNEGQHEPSIISFDLSKEQITMVSSPMPGASLLGLTKWNDKICEVRFGKEHQSINLWMLDNSTEHLCTLRHEIQLGEVDGNVQLLTPYSIKINRVFIATFDKIFYHEVSGKHDNINEIKVKHPCETKYCFAYVESLLPVPK
jgi:F-box interacting protein